MTTLTTTHVDYELLIEEEPAPGGNEKPRWVGCKYPNGDKIHGKDHTKHGKHPTLVISVKHQNQVIWSGPGPFEIEIKLPDGKDRPDNLFHRPKGAWQATQGNDGIWRVASGPANAEGVGVETVEYKFAAFALDDKLKRKDNVEELDPHIILEP